MRGTTVVYDRHAVTRLPLWFGLPVQRLEVKVNLPGEGKAPEVFAHPKRGLKASPGRRTVTATARNVQDGRALTLDVVLPRDRLQIPDAQLRDPTAAMYADADDGLLRKLRAGDHPHIADLDDPIPRCTDLQSALSELMPLSSLRLVG